MRFRLIALIGLVLGLSRLAFPAVMTAPYSRPAPGVRAAAVKQKARGARKARRPAPLRRKFVLPKTQQPTPLLPAPELMLALVEAPQMPMLARAELTGTVQAAQPRLAYAWRRVLVIPNEFKPLLSGSSSNWTAAGRVGRTSGVNAPPARLMAAGGDPRLDYQHRQHTIGLTIRI